MIISGILTGEISSSYIYLISYSQYIYIGETGSHPAVRWGNHLGKRGTFLVNLYEMEGEQLSSEEDIFFISIKCNEIDCEDVYKRKIARRAVEAELHRSYALNPDVFGPDSRIISRPPSDPVWQSFRFDPCTIAKEIYSEISKRYQEWKLS
ncbi:hypothetical protein MT962_003153 [Franconibacter sp. IITDAS19]|uniref:hypothetical protein n=1 Tax=Franconibacter sp. IITDAS19 TaxID=2930569 RepID=UPI001FF98DF0|nr:hypothetical protein [Franconibacter sp. IITDAS19]MCK1969294.1 hypothetical protein [Franconibacter sp. IITDAS19]